MICSELMSNKFDFHKVTFKIYVHQIVLNTAETNLRTVSALKIALGMSHIVA